MEQFVRLLPQQPHLTAKLQQFAQLVARQGTASVSEQIRRAFDLGSLLTELIVSGL